jgi:hypothetical protein
MTDAEIRASKWQHMLDRAGIRRQVRESTPSRMFWQDGLWVCDSCQAAWHRPPACKDRECPVMLVSR